MVFEEAMSLALSVEQLTALSEAQKRLLNNRLGLLIDKYQDQVTPEMIQGQYEMVTVHLLPPELW